MSRGIGDLQRGILEAIEQHGGQLSAADTARALHRSPAGVPSRSLRENVRRAAASLAAIGCLSATKKRDGGSARLIYYLPNAVVRKVLEDDVTCAPPPIPDKPDSADEYRDQGGKFKYQAEIGRVNKAFLLKRGWTRTAITRLLGKPDSKIVRWNRWKDRPECFFDMQRVLQAEEVGAIRFRRKAGEPVKRLRGDPDFCWRDGRISPLKSALRKKFDIVFGGRRVLSQWTRPR
jgi:hypothetical protein